MQAFHQSRDQTYRSPFGAVPVRTAVRLAIQVKPEQDDIKAVYLCYAYGLYSFQESRLHLIKSSTETGSATHLEDAVSFAGECPMPAEPCLFFYWFEIQTGSGRIFYTANHDDADGSGWLGFNHPRYLPGEPHVPAAFQITVHAADFLVPEWLSGGVLYQIFPDRFNRDRSFQPTRFEHPAIRAEERIFHLDWDEDVDFSGKPETGYLACDFFGGSLNGIREKLDYIQRLGVDILYLNPIFRARSNHRYDTGDYEQIDPLLGSSDDLAALCAEARARGIRIILDGVFSHTGADSRYFNKFGRYPEIGAYQEMQGAGFSPYGTWFTFHRKGEEYFYDSWWGFSDLPSVNEHDLSYRRHITGPDGIVRRWLRLGVSGWRIDVSDELPDSFLRELRSTVREENPEAVLLGEVWEDASCKISYGTYRDFLLGRTHDNIMGYPFQQTLFNWLGHHSPARHLVNQLETLRERYPLASFYSSMNLISSHDIPRAITTLAGLSDPGHRDLQARLHLSAAARQRGVALLRLAWMFQIAFPGIAALYYGDETAMEGYRDPFNRRTFPWGQVNASLQAWFAELGQLRRRLPVLRTGYFRFLLAEDDIVVFERSLQDGRDVFGREQDGPARILAAFNRQNNPRSFTLAGYTYQLPAFGGLLEFETNRMTTGDASLLVP